MMVEGILKQTVHSTFNESLNGNSFEKPNNKSLFQLAKSNDKSKLKNALLSPEYKYNPGEVNENGETALIVACKCKRWANAFTLLDHFGEQTLPFITDKNGFNAIYYVEAINLIDRLLVYQKEISDLSRVYNNGESLLTKLIIDGKIAQCEKIIRFISLENLNHVNNNGKTALILACEFSHYNIAYELINKGVSLTFYDHNGYSALSYLLNKKEDLYTKEKLDLCFMFVDKGKPNQQNISTNQFTVYETGRFTSITKLPDSISGNYGKMKWAIDSVTGEHKILKCYRSYIKLLTEDVIKEIVFIRKLNETVNEVIKIDGIYIDNEENVHIVLKPLTMTLYDYFKLISYYPIPQNLRIIDIFNKLENIIEKIHSNGIVHNDLKLENIMFDYDGNIVVLDLGIADFIGISPYRHVIENYLTTSYIKAPDSGEEIKVTIVDEINKNIDDDKVESPKKNKQYKETKSFTYKSTRKSYSSDIYSFGVSMIQGILKKNARFISINDSIYRVLKIDNDSSIKKENDRIVIEKILDDDLVKLKSFPFYNNLIRMINIDGNTRIKRNSNFNNPTTYKKSSNNLINRSIHYTPHEIKNKLHELVYMDKIHEVYSNSTLIMDPSENRNEYVTIFEKILSKINNRISMDTYLNALYNSINYKGNEDTIIISLSYFYIYSYIFEWYFVGIDVFASLFDISEHILIGKINSTIISLIPTITFIPFNMLIGKMIVSLQIDNCDSDNITKIETIIYDNFIDYLCNKSKKETIYIWDFIQCFVFSNLSGLTIEANFKDDNSLNIFSRFN